MERTKQATTTAIVLALNLLFLAPGSAAQEHGPYLPGDGLGPAVQPATDGADLRATFPLLVDANRYHAAPFTGAATGLDYTGASSSAGSPGAAPVGVRRITLGEAQQQAADHANPLLRLGELQVEAARQHRLGVQSLYFPNISGQFLNLHFNKLPGELLAVHRPIVGSVIAIPVNILEKNSSPFNFAAVQPVTPLFAIHQLVKVARADETIARAKAGLPLLETGRRVEENYFDLLVAERELVSAQATAKKVQGRWLTASLSAAPAVSPEQESDMLAADKAVLLANSKVKDLTVSLNLMLGLPVETSLELVPPEPLVENVSLEEVADKVKANPEVVEAEQTAVKARAGHTLAKLEYAPSVAIIGGYTNQNMLNVILPRDYSYIGVMATYTIFDFGKREHDVKERAAQVKAAELGVELTKAKVGAEIKKSYFELERSRQLSQLARRIVGVGGMLNVTYQPDNPEAQAGRASMEAAMFQAELQHRQAFAQLMSLVAKKNASY